VHAKATTAAARSNLFGPRRRAKLELFFVAANEKSTGAPGTGFANRSHMDVFLAKA
jgi:hypothetical protein